MVTLLATGPFAVRGFLMSCPALLSPADFQCCQWLQGMLLALPGYGCTSELVSASIASERSEAGRRRTAGEGALPDKTAGARDCFYWGV